MDRLWAWECFCLKFTEQDLKTVIQFIMNKERQHKPHRALTFRSFISGPDSLTFFMEDLVEAKAMKRAVPVTAKDKVLEQSGRPKPVQYVARSAAEILAGEEALKELIKLRDNL